MPEIVRKIAVVVIDERTTTLCLAVAGQTRGVNEPFDTANGQFDNPPFHVGCRTITGTYVVGQGRNTIAARATLEILRRPKRGKLPPAARENPPVR